MDRKEGDVPSSFLIQPSCSIGDLLVGVAAHGVSGFLLDEIESCTHSLESTPQFLGGCILEERGGRLTFVTIILILVVDSSSLLLLLSHVGVATSIGVIAAHLLLGFVEEIHFFGIYSELVLSFYNII